MKVGGMGLLNGSWVDAAENFGLSPADVCVYCGQAFSKTYASRLSDEHVVPEGLGGNLIVPRASCSSCANVTSKYERFIAQQMLDILRKKVGITGKKKKRPASKNEYPIYVTANGIVTTHFLSADDYPFGIMIPAFPPPAIFREQLFGAISPLNTYESWFPVKQSSVENIRERLAADRVEIPSGKVDDTILAKLLMKIAHSYAVGSLGSKGFQPLYKNMPLCDKYNIHYVVGGSDRIGADISGRHLLRLRTATSAGRELVVVDICLFHDMGFPTYQCVVGFTNKERNPRFFKRLFSLGRSFEEEVLHQRVPTFTGTGYADWVCGHCDNIVLQGVTMLDTYFVTCQECAAINTYHFPDKSFCASEAEVRSSKPGLATTVPFDLDFWQIQPYFNDNGQHFAMVVADRRGANSLIDTMFGGHAPSTGFVKGELAGMPSAEEWQNVLKV